MPKQPDTNADIAVLNGDDTISPSTPAPADPAHHLVVIHPFGQYSKGMKITDGDDIADILAGENARFCNKVLPS